MLQVFCLDVAYVLQCLSKCFQVCVSSVSDTCFKCFSCLQKHVANVTSVCFKSRSGIAHVAMAPVAGEQQPTAGLRLLPRVAHLALSSPSLPFPSLPSDLVVTVRARPGHGIRWHRSGMGREAGAWCNAGGGATFGTRAAGVG